MKYRTIDLFCGAGGFSKGFELTKKFHILKGYDNNDVALKTFSKNHQGEGINYDIREAVPNELKNNVDVVIGSPPCQGFSDAKGSRSLEDERNDLVFHFIRWVNEIKPKVFVMENVAGLLTIDDNFVKEVERRYDESGYYIDYNIYNSKDFGVPQKRKRAIFVGINKEFFGNNLLNEIMIEKRSSFVTVEEAICDLPSPSKDGIGKYKHNPQNQFQEIMRNNSDVVYNNLAKYPKDKDMFIVEKIPEGKMYRSTRFGNRYVGVWDLFKDEFTYNERLILWFIARHRGRKDYKVTKKNGPDYIAEEKIIESIPTKEVLEEAAKYGFNIEEKPNIKSNVIKDLAKRGWLRDKKVKRITAYDLNTRSGLRPRYMRFHRNEQSNTILTTDFDAREKLHYIENRGISLREGARIQSFPDDFIFEGNFDEIATQIGNAVPPLMAMTIANYIYNLIQITNSKVITKTG